MTRSGGSADDARLDDIRFGGMASIWGALIPARPDIRANHLIEGSRIAVACAAPVIISELIHQPPLAWAGIAAFWACLADPGGPVRIRFAAMASLTAIGVLSVAAGIWAADTSIWLAVALAFIWSFGGSFAGLFGGVATSIGRLLTVTFLVSIGVYANGTADIVPASLYFLIGGIWAMVLVLILWRTHPYQPGRRTLNASYEALSDFAEDIARLARQSAGPGDAERHKAAWDTIAMHRRSRVRQEIEQTRQVVAALGRARPGARAPLERQLILAEYADRYFAALIAFSDLLETNLLGEMEADEAGAAHLDAASVAAICPPLEKLSALLRNLGVTILRDRQAVSPARAALLADLNAQLVAATRAAHGQLDQGTGSEMTEAASTRLLFVHLLDTILALAEGARAALAGQAPVDSTIASTMATARAGAATVGAATDGGRQTDSASQHRARLLRRISIGLRQRVRLGLRQMRDNLTWSSTPFRHALRVGVTVALALYITLTFRLGHGYWLTMTTALILQPYIGSTWRTALQRMAGSVAGGIFAAFLGTIITDPLIAALAVFPLSIATNVFRAIDYALFTFFLTPQFVLIAGLGTGTTEDAALAGLRALDSVLGGLLALAASFLLWPNREARQLPLQLAKAIEAGRGYLTCVLQAKAQAAPDIAMVETSRRQAGLGSNNAEASLQRWLGEPGHDRQAIEPVMTLITTLRRQAGTVTTFWVAPVILPQQHTAEIRACCDWIAASLDAMAEALRRQVPLAALPPAPPLGEIKLDASTDGLLLRETLARLYVQIDIMREALRRLAAAWKD